MTEVHQGPSRFVTGHGGVPIAVVGFGGEGIPVLFLHGLAGHGGEWSRVASLLPPGVHALALDLRGHGNSEPRPLETSVAAHVEDVIAVAEEVFPGQPLCLVGQSLGGIIAVVAAARRPDLVRSLVVVEAAPSGPHPDAAARTSRWLDSWAWPFPDRERAIAFFGGSPHADGWVDGLDGRPDGWWPRFNREVVVATSASAAGRAWWDEWAGARCPALLVRGESGWISGADLETMAGMVPQAELATVNGSGHDVHLDNPVGFTEVLIPFLRRSMGGATWTRMGSADVLRVLATLAKGGVESWLEGGWGVDAVAGRQTRPHADLDLVLAMSDVPSVIAALEGDGFSRDEDLRPCSFTMVAADGRKVDIHPVTWNQDGGVQVQPDGTAWTYPTRGFSGMGRVDGQAVRCLSAEVQILCHFGYDLDDHDIRDLKLLRSVLEDESPEVRARWRDLVRQGYDAISTAYRDDEGRSNSATDEHTDQYRAWVEELALIVNPGGRVLDLGCGAGLPTTRGLVMKGFQAVGLDISSVQIERARRLVPGAHFIHADMATWDAEPASFDAVVSFYSLIHVPLQDQLDLLPRIRRWLRPDGIFLAIVGHGRWTGVEDYLGAPMFWDHVDTASYLDWLRRAGLMPVWDRFIPEGASGHALVLARAV